MQQAKKPPKKVDVGVILLFYGSEVLLFERKEALLRGMYVFLLNEKDAGISGALQALSRLGAGHTELEEIGGARHIFTHRVWQMRLYAARAAKRVMPEGAVWADLALLNRLPLPVAMKAAAQKAREILGQGL